jgi:hypothetical protein
MEREEALVAAIERGKSAATAAVVPSSDEEED